MASSPDMEKKESPVLDADAPHRRSAAPIISEKDASYGEFIEVDENVHVINAFIDKVGMGRYQWQLWVLAGFGWTTDQMLLQMLAVINPRWSKEFGTPTAIIGGVQSCYLAGLAVGAAFWGYGADIWGRKLAFNCTLLTAGVFATILGGMPNYGGLCVMAGLMGVGTGGNLPLDGAIFLEASPQVSQRILMLLSAFWQIGQVIASLVGWGFLGAYSCSGTTPETCPKSENMGWRYTTITLGCFVLLMWIARFFLFTFFESPKNLLARGMQDRAIDSLNGIAKYNKCNHRITADDFSETSSQASAIEHHKTKVLKEKLRQFGWQQIKPLFSTKKMAFTTIILWTIWSLIQVAYTMFNGFLPYFLAQKNVSSGGNTLDDTYRQYIYISISGIPGSFIAWWTVEIPYIGRKGTMAISGAISAACLALFAELNSPGGQLAANCIQACVGNVFYATLYGASPEIFPTYCRGTGVGMASMLARVFAVWVPVVTGTLAAISVNIPLIISAICFGLLAPLSLMLPIETRGRHAM